MRVILTCGLALALTSSASAGTQTARFVLDDGRASAIFPDGAPIKMTMTPQSLPGVDPSTERGPLGRLPPSESWMDHGNGQTYTVMVTRTADARYPLIQRCGPASTFTTAEHSTTRTCRMVNQAGMAVAEHRTTRDDGMLTVMRSFEVGDRRYAVTFMRMGDKLRAQAATVMPGPGAREEDGEAFLNSFRLENRPATH